MALNPDLEGQPGYSLQIGMAQDATQQMSSELLAWKRSPFRMLGDKGVVLRHLRIPRDADAGAVSADDRDLEKIYIDMRTQAAINGIVIVVVEGRNKAGKGVFNMGLYTLFDQDPYLEFELGQHGFVSKEIKTVPFAHCAEAVKLRRVGLVKPDLTPSTYRFNDERKISGFQWDLVQGLLPPEATDADEVSEILRRRGQAKIILVESSTPLVWPTTLAAPVEVEGTHDLGSSTFLNATLSSKTRKHTFALMIHRGKNVLTDRSSNSFRNQVFSENPDLDSLYGDETQVMVRSGEAEVNASVLSKEEQEELQALLQISMAPLTAIKKLDRARNRLLISLYQRGIIPEPTDLAYYGRKKEILAMPKNRCEIPVNTWFGGQKDYPTGYLRSHVVDEFPEILDVARKRLHPLR